MLEVGGLAGAATIGARLRLAGHDGPVEAEVTAIDGERAAAMAFDPTDALVSGTAADERDPQGLAVGLARLVSDRGWGVDVAVGAVIGRWASVVGAEVAQHCEPESFEDGVLLVRTDSTSWATNLKLLAPQLLRRLADDVGEDVVREVRVLGPAGPGFKRGPRSVPGRGPRDTFG